MPGKDFRDEVVNKLRALLSRTGLEAESGEPLYYRPSLSKKTGQPILDAEPIRGVNAFETDILVRKKRKRPMFRAPLVVIEAKGSFGGSTTHDAITYSAKARNHKVFYPYLRYGLVTKDDSISADRTLYHGTGFDFIVALGSRPKRGQWSRLAKVVREQASVAERLLQLSKKGLDAEVSEFSAVVKLR